jgi:hypothetical protein
MNALTAAKRVIQLNNAVHSELEQNLAQDMTLANSAIEHTTDANAKQALGILRERINKVRSVFVELYSPDTQELIAIVLAEEIHFKRTRLKNDKAAFLQRQARLDRGAIPRPQYELKRTTMQIDAEGPSIPITQPDEHFIETPTYKRIAAEIRAQHWPNVAQEPEPHGGRETVNAIEDQTTAEIIAKEQQENERLFGNLDLDHRAAQELELMRSAQTQAQTPTPPPPYISPTAHLTMDERIARRKALGTIEEMPPLSPNLTPPGETYELTPEQLAQAQGSEPLRGEQQNPPPAQTIPNATPNAKRPRKIPTEANISYAPGVISTSVPSLEELNQAGLNADGKDLL